MSRVDLFVVGMQLTEIHLDFPELGMMMVAELMVEFDLLVVTAVELFGRVVGYFVVLVVEVDYLQLPFERRVVQCHGNLLVVV